MSKTYEKKTKTSTYQVLLLDNTPSQDVKVHEAEQVDFCEVKEHLKKGGSVFITSCSEQKISRPQYHAQSNYARSRRCMGFLFRQNLRT